MKKSLFFQTPESRKGDILTAALKIIDRCGIKGLTVARLAKEVGFVESALYRHFRAKRDLIAFILDQILQEARRHFQAVEESLGDVSDGLRKLLHLHLSFLEQYPGIFKIIYSDELHLGDKELLDKLDQLTMEIVRFIKKIMKKGKEQKRLDGELDETIGALHFLGLVYTAFSYWTIKKRKVSLKRIGERLLRQYLEGARAKA